MHKHSYHTQGFALRLWLQSLFMLLIIATISACSSSSSSDADGELVVSLTDAEGDFLTYTVDVVSLKMIKQNGAEIETLPLTTTLDFAQYVEVSEFLTTATVPSGAYKGAQIVLDYSNASITVQNEAGDAVSASAVDADGNPLGQVTVDISLNGSSEFVIAPGIPAHFTLDFDLNASNEVSLNGDSATVTVKPVLVADTLLEDPKPHRLRGLLDEVDEAAQQFTVKMRPFRHLQQRFGKLTAHVNNDTRYEIDGIAYGSDTGLTQLATLDTNSPMIVIGELQQVDDQRQFIASEVYAGSSVPWGDKDIVRGHVVARDGDLLTIRGASIVRADNSFIFNDTLQVQLDTNTKVLKQADTGSYTTDDISVGQRVTILGTFLNTTDLSMLLDADLVRMRFTSLRGQVLAVSPLAIDLQSIDLRRATIFDFSGTGIDAANDADINNYEIDTGSLTLANLQIGDPIKLRGFVTPFGTAPEDFTARTIADVKNMKANLIVGYGDGSTSAISSIDENGLQLDLSDAGKLHHLSQAGVVTDLTTLDTMPLITPEESGKGLFMISRAFATRLYVNYSNFQQALADDLANGRSVISVHAKGYYDGDQATLTARQINVRLSR